MQGDRDNAGSNLQAEVSAVQRLDQWDGSILPTVQQQYDTKRVRKHVNDQCPGIVNMTSAGKTNGNRVSPALNLSTLAACCDACSKASNCKWFAFTPPGSVKKGDTCWLFKTITSLGKKGKGNFTLVQLGSAAPTPPGGPCRSWHAELYDMVSGVQQGEF